jgi:long-subunit fatty acid transport protein
MVCIGPFSSSFAQPLQRIEIPSSPNPVGSGARALGMGGAFIAVADDATAASWNPGGLIQLERPEVSVVGAGFDRTEDNTFGTNPEASGSQSISEGRINYLSLAYPFRLFGHNMIVSANYQHLYDFNREWDFLLNRESSSLSTTESVDYVQEGDLSAYGLAYCVQIVLSLSFGFTLNFWEDGIYDNEWEQRTHQKGSGTLAGWDLAFETEIFDRYSFSGFNANLGLLWRLGERLTIGAVVKTPFEADLKHESSFSSALRFPEFPEIDQEDATSSVTDEELDMPLSYGIGLAYRFSDNFTASLDVYRTEWDDFVLTDEDGNETSPITGTSVSESDVEPTHQVRLGAEYLFIGTRYVVPLRAGVFYDPAPADGNPDDYYGFSLGTGLAVGRFIFDIAYQYRFGNDVSTHVLKGFDFSQDVEEHTVYGSFILHL